MHGFYKANGGCGYVKEPDFLMQTCPDGKAFDPKADLPVRTTLKGHVSFSFFLFSCFSLSWEVHPYMSCLPSMKFRNGPTR
jgi:hypothetical protein